MTTCLTKDGNCKTHTVMGWIIPILIATIMMIGLSLMQVTRGEQFDSVINAQSFKIFISCFVAAWLLLLVLWRRFIPSIQSSTTYPWRQAIIIIAISMLIRAVGVMVTTPQLSDDIWRYLYDGKVLAAGDNPYRLSPMDRGALDETDSEVNAHGQINHPHLITIYPPVSQYGFAASMKAASIFRGSQITVFGVGQERFFRYHLMLVEVALLFLLAIALAKQRVSPHYLWLYAVHPLALSEVMATGHQDVQGMFLWLAAILLWPDFDRNSKQDSERPARLKFYARYLFAGLLWGMSLLVKPVTLPVAVYMCLRDRGRWRGGLVFIGGGVISCAICLLPFLWMEGGLAGLIQTGRTFSMHWQFNGPLNQWLTGLAGHVSFTHLFLSCTVIVAAIVMAMNARMMRMSRWEVSAVIMMLSLLVSSTVHPWYLLWGLMFLSLSRLWSLHLFGVLIVLGYVAIMHAEYRMPYWLSVLTHGFIWLALAAEIGWRLRLRDDSSVASVPQM